MPAISDAFRRVCDGYSADRVLVDPELNARFIAECRADGLTDEVPILNRRLLNLRKKSGLADQKTKRRTTFREEPEYRFAAEIAARFVERKHALSLDRVLCDPLLVTDFDCAAIRIVPGFTPLQYRWAALNLRKSKRLPPELVARVAAAPAAVHSWSMRDFDLCHVPTKAGLYLIHDGRQLLYVGESDNLRQRLKKHLDHSDNKGFARWLWESGVDALHIEIHELATGISARARRALELELIRSRHPVFNIQR